MNGQPKTEMCGDERRLSSSMRELSEKARATTLSGCKCKQEDNGEIGLEEGSKLARARDFWS